MNVISTKPVSILQVKEELAKRKDEGELGYEQAQAFDHAENIATMTPEKHKKLLSELMEVEGMTEATAIKILDVMPKQESTLRAMLVKDRIEINDGNLENIVKMFK